MRHKAMERGFGFSMIDQTILMINLYGRPLFIKQEIKNNVISFDVCLNKQNILPFFAEITGHDGSASINRIPLLANEVTEKIESIGKMN